MLTASDLLPQDRRRAWELAYGVSLDEHPDEEIAWEAQLWRELGAHPIADICDQLLAERRAFDFFMPAETTPHGLTALWQHVPHDDVFGWVGSEGLCLLAAMRLAYAVRPFTTARML